MTSTWTHAGHFRGLAAQVLPRDGECVVWDDGGDLIMQSSWRIPDAAPAVHGRSTAVRIRISHEAQEDYDTSSMAQRSMMDQRFIKAVRRRLAEYDPKPRPPFGASAPETWIIGTAELNGRSR